MACRRRASGLLRNCAKVPLRDCAKVPKIVSRQQIRCLSLHESHSQQLLKRKNVPILDGRIVQTPREAREAAEQMNCWLTIKPRLHDANITRIQYETDLREGLKRHNNPAAVEGFAQKMLGWKARTPQYDGTYKEHLIRSLYLSEMAPKGQPAWFLSLTIDRERYCPVLVLQEVISGKTNQFHFSSSAGISVQDCEAVAELMGSAGDEIGLVKDIIKAMYQIWMEKDVTLMKLKLVRFKEKEKPRLACQTSTMVVDDASAKRQPGIFHRRDPKDADPEEAEAEKSGLVYVKMDGNIGNVVNGAGLAMATNDAIDYYGGKSANFLDAGGQATKETMVKAFDIVLRDKRVKAIIVNVYGGITNCAMIADSILAAAVQLGPLQVPIVVRLQGTNSATGLKILEDANLGLHVESDFGAAAAKVVELAGPYERQENTKFGTRAHGPGSEPNGSLKDPSIAK